MNPYAVLGISQSASNSEAKAAYRKLAMEHHPDRGGSEARFKEIKAAWEWIESGKPVFTAPPKQPDEKPYKSSFSDPPGTTRQPPRPTGWKHEQPKTAGKPAPGYEEKGTSVLARTRTTYNRSAHGSVEVHNVDLEISPRHAFEGCTVPFIHRGNILHYIVLPGSVSKNVVEQFQVDPTIGSQRGVISINVNLRVVEPAPKREEPKQPKEEPKPESKDHRVEYRICALGLFSGGKIDARDNQNVVVPIVIPPGYNPVEPIIVKGKGYGPEGQRGDLIVKIEPVFKAPQDLNSKELKMLQRLNDLTKAV